MTDYHDLGTYRRNISTEFADAQLWFDRGLIWCYGFNHEEAKRCFNEVAEIDPGCAMAYWGIAYAAGPSYGKPWVAFDKLDLSQSLIEADAATQTAIELADCASAVEQAIIRTLPHRYPSEAPVDDLSAWDDDYADAMRDVYNAFPGDLDVAALCAEALMARTPHALWDSDSGEPAEGADTMEAAAILETAIRHMEQEGSYNPGALHLYVRLMEESPHPERAQHASDKLKEVVPDADWQAGVWPTKA